MTANNTQQEILKAFSQDRKIPQFTILELLQKSKINFIDQSTVEETIKRLQKEIDETIIPPPINTLKISKTKENPITREVKYKYETRDVYQDEEKVKELKKKIKDNKTLIKFLKDLLVYTKPPFVQQDEPKAETSKKKKSNKLKKDTTPIDKHNFIDTFIDKSKQVIFKNQKDIATNCNVSEPWISNHFSLEFLKKLFDEMNTEYNLIIKRESKSQLYQSYEAQNNNEIFYQNFSYLKKLLENKEDKANFDKARNELKKAVPNKT